MSKKKKTFFIIFVLMIILIIAVLILYLTQTKPSGSPSIVEDLSPVQVRIINPSTNSGWPLNYNIPIRVSAQANNPISKMVLSVNGIAIKETISIQIGPDNLSYLTQFDWIPGNAGDFILTIQAFDEQGGNGISNAVLITAVDAIATRSQIEINDGDTLETIALENDIDLKDVQQANPEINPSAKLDPEEIIYLPNPPLLETEPDAVLPLSPADAGEQKSNIPENDTVPSQDSDLPYAPTIFSKYEGCEVKLRIENIGYFADSDNPDTGKFTKEAGFYVYRSRDGGEFERIATFPAYLKLASNPNDFYAFTSDWSYIDSEQFGYLTYYISAFNASGEADSAPVVIPLNKNNCLDPDQAFNQNFLRLDEDGNLQSMFNFDLAYLYIQINDGQAFRVPEGDRFFLPDSGIKFNIFDYLDSISSGIYLSDIKLHMEVWGWLAGKLTHIGDIDQFIDRSVLLICSEEGQGSCGDGGNGQWVQEIDILSNSLKPLDQQKYDIRWQITNMTTASKVCLGISMREFYGPGITDTSFRLFYSCNVQSSTGGYPKGNEGVITLDFGRLLYPEDPSKIKNTMKAGDDYQYPEFENEYPLGSPFTMYLRFVAGVNDYQFQDTSNTAIMHYQTQSAPPDLPPLASDIPSLYDVQILEDTYHEPKYEVWEKSGCIIVDYDPTGKYPAGKELCPLTYLECGVNVECSGFWDYVGAGWDVIVNAINGAKGFISDVVSKTIPGCSGSSLCKDAIDKGIDYGVTAMTGIPPDLPNFEELAAQGITESIILGLSGISGEDVSYVCGDTCKNEITKQILPYIKQAKNVYSQPACYSGGGHYGFYPPCLDSSIDVHPVEGSADFPAFVMVRITRKDTPESLNAGDEINGKIKLHVIVDGENPSGAGLFYDKCTYGSMIPLEQLPDPSYPNGGGLANWRYKYLGDNGLAEPLYIPVDITIPSLQPGQSIDLPVKLVQTGNNYSPDCTLYNSRSQYLFYGGISHMNAAEYCYSSGSSWDWVPCTNGGKDSWGFANPAGP